MNIMLNKEEFLELIENVRDDEVFVVGSKMMKDDTPESDTDYLVMIGDEHLGFEGELLLTFNNSNLLQYKDTKNNKDYIFVPEATVGNLIVQGKESIIIEGFIFNKEFREDAEMTEEEVVDLFRTRKVINMFLGLAKRDLADKSRKKHVIRSMYIAEKLLKNELPTVEGYHSYRIDNKKRSGSSLKTEIARMKGMLNLDSSIKNYNVHPSLLDAATKPGLKLLNNLNTTTFKY